jgi:hypothetical protein
MKLEERMAVHERKMLRAEMYEKIVPAGAIQGEEAVTALQSKGNKTRGKKSNESQVSIIACMEILKSELGTSPARPKDSLTDSGSQVEEVLISLDNTSTCPGESFNVPDKLSKVLGIPTRYWKGDEASLPEGKRMTVGEESRAYWPTQAEFKMEGDERVRYRDLGLTRRLPLPKLDMLSAERACQLFETLDLADANGDQGAAERLLYDMVEMTDQQIESQYQAIAPYEGALDGGLVSIEMQYEQDMQEKRMIMAVKAGASLIENSRGGWPLAIPYDVVDNFYDSPCNPLTNGQSWTHSAGSNARSHASARMGHNTNDFQPRYNGHSSPAAFSQRNLASQYEYNDDKCADYGNIPLPHGFNTSSRHDAYQQVHDHPDGLQFNSSVEMHNHILNNRASMEFPELCEMVGWDEVFDALDSDSIQT